MELIHFDTVHVRGSVVLQVVGWSYQIFIRLSPTRLWIIQIMVSIRKTVGFTEPQLHCVCSLLRWQAMAIVQDGVGLAAHLNHYWEMVYPEKQDHQKALLIVGKFHNDCPGPLPHKKR